MTRGRNIIHHIKKERAKAKKGLDRDTNEMIEAYGPLFVTWLLSQSVEVINTVCMADYMLTPEDYPSELGVFIPEKDRELYNRKKKEMEERTK